jgi:uncharacterized protein involved in exopolysaccharide biosynthesis
MVVKLYFQVHIVLKYRLFIRITGPQYVNRRKYFVTVSQRQKHLFVTKKFYKEKGTNERSCCCVFLLKMKRIDVIKLLEAIFRRLMLLVIMLLIPAIIGVGVAYLLPPSYQASATLWAFKRYEVIGATGAESDLQATPAQTQATALTELLQTSEFDVPVAKSANLKSALKLSQKQLTDPQALSDAYVANLAKNVQVAAKGTNLYQITYTAGDQNIARKVVSAVITQFQVQGPSFSVYAGKQLLQVDQAQLAQAQLDARTALQNESAYRDSHPGATVANDPEYAQLDQVRLQAESTRQNLQASITTLTQAIDADQKGVDQSKGSNAFFRVVDPPVTPDASSRSKTLSTTGGIGAAVGLVACILYILIIVRRDRAMYSPLDVQKVTSYPILMQVPQLRKGKKEPVPTAASK